MSRKRTGQHETFADIAEGLQADSSQGQPVMYPSLIGDREYTDDQGVHWRMRRGELRWSRFEQLVRDPAVQVIHVYLSDINHVPLTDREALLTRVQPYLKGQRELGDHTDFTAAEFKDDQHRSSLVIEESC